MILIKKLTNLAILAIISICALDIYAFDFREPEKTGNHLVEGPREGFDRHSEVPKWERAYDKGHQGESGDSRSQRPGEQEIDRHEGEKGEDAGFGEEGVKLKLNNKISNSEEKLRNLRDTFARMERQLPQEILGLKEGFTQQDVNRAFRKLNLEYHPDKQASWREELSSLESKQEAKDLSNKISKLVNDARDQVNDRLENPEKYEKRNKPSESGEQKERALDRLSRAISAAIDGALDSLSRLRSNVSKALSELLDSFMRRLNALFARSKGQPSMSSEEKEAMKEEVRSEVSSVVLKKMADIEKNTNLSDAQRLEQLTLLTKFEAEAKKAIEAK